MWGRRLESLEELYSFIPTGKENGISMKRLAELYGVGERELRQAVTKARMHGFIIAGTAAGYYRPADCAELREYYHIVSERGKTAFASIEAARQELERLGECCG